MADKGNYQKPEDLTKWQKFKRLVWNSDSGEFFGRTGGSWFKIILFYIIFYACLAAFWTCMLVVFYETLAVDEPKWTLDRSRIGTSPGLGFRPTPPESVVDSTLIWYNATKNETVTYWVDNLNEFQKPYILRQVGGNIQQCVGDQVTNKEKVCHFPIQKGQGEACSPERQFGFPEGKPCILIKLNRIYGWQPEPYETAPEELEKQLPADQPYDPNNVYITCQGENSADRDNIGSVTYRPSMGISKKYFPFMNQKDYVSPYIFVQFQNINRGVLVNVECRAWAKNIIFDRGDRLGSVHFELLVD